MQTLYYKVLCEFITSASISYLIDCMIHLKQSSVLSASKALKDHFLVVDLLMRLVVRDFFMKWDPCKDLLQKENTDQFWRHIHVCLNMRVTSPLSVCPPPPPRLFQLENNCESLQVSPVLHSTRSMGLCCAGFLGDQRTLQTA